jgi:U4/U6.U5 tri-snRNP-associated protein 3
VDLNSAVAVSEDEMMRQMGFAGFDTTKNKKVEGNITGMAKVNKPRKYRQYMNRKGGFNRPLDFIA